MATHSSVLAWRIPGTEEPGGLPSMGSCRVRHDWSDLAAAAAPTYEGTERSHVSSLLNLSHILKQTWTEDCRKAMTKKINRSKEASWVLVLALLWTWFRAPGHHLIFLLISLLEWGLVICKHCFSCNILGSCQDVLCSFKMLCKEKYFMHYWGPGKPQNS